jgi:ubiquinone/menaquinone biosynthesis C-methylase UbiE
MAKIVQRVIANDIDGKLMEVARLRLEESGVKNCDYVEGDAYDIAGMVTHPVDFVFLANAFHGVPDKPRLSRAVRAILKPGGCFAVINWYARPREETTVLDQPRGPATELRMTTEATIAEVEPSGLKLRNIVEVSPYQGSAHETEKIVR